MSPSKKVNGSKFGKLKDSTVKAISPENTVTTAKKTPDNLPILKPATNIGTSILRVLAIAAVIGIIVYIYSVHDRMEEFSAYGYPGIFLIALMANATIFLPAPGVAIVFAMGSIFNPIGVALAAGAGGALGELSGFLAGFSGQAVVERTDVYTRINPWIRKYGGWSILVLSAIPNPFFDIAGIAAGMAKMKFWKFLLFCWAGQTIKMAIFAFAGAYSIDWIASFYK